MPVLQDVVAERRFEGGGEGGVTVRLGRPVRHPSGDWNCPFQVVGLRGGEIHAAFGVDALQALVLAIQMIRLQLEEAQAEHGLKWLGGDDLGLA